jgi:hypothetical protein
MTPDQPPELVFVPARPQVSGGRDVAYETRTLADGTVALPVYSAVTKLVAALGHYQPWMCLPLRTVRADMEKAGVHQVVVDAEVDTSAWRWQEGGLRTLANGQRGWELPVCCPAAARCSWFRSRRAGRRAMSPARRRAAPGSGSWSPARPGGRTRDRSSRLPGTGNCTSATGRAPTSGSRAARPGCR